MADNSAQETPLTSSPPINPVSTEPEVTQALPNVTRESETESDQVFLNETGVLHTDGGPDVEDTREVTRSPADVTEDLNNQTVVVITEETNDTVTYKTPPSRHLNPALMPNTGAAWKSNVFKPVVPDFLTKQKETPHVLPSSNAGKPMRTLQETIQKLEKAANRSIPLTSNTEVASASLNQLNDKKQFDPDISQRTSSSVGDLATSAAENAGTVLTSGTHKPWSRGHHVIPPETGGRAFSVEVLSTHSNAAITLEDLVPGTYYFNGTSFFPVDSVYAPGGSDYLDVDVPGDTSPLASSSTSDSDTEDTESESNPIHIHINLDLKDILKKSNTTIRRRRRREAKRQTPEESLHTPTVPLRTYKQKASYRKPDVDYSDDPEMTSSDGTELSATFKQTVGNFSYGLGDNGDDRILPHMVGHSNNDNTDSQSTLGAIGDTNRDTLSQAGPGGLVTCTDEHLEPRSSILDMKVPLDQRWMESAKAKQPPIRRSEEVYEEVDGSVWDTISANKSIAIEAEELVRSHTAWFYLRKQDGETFVKHNRKEGFFAIVTSDNIKNTPEHPFLLIIVHNHRIQYFPISRSRLNKTYKVCGCRKKSSLKSLVTFYQEHKLPTLGIKLFKHDGRKQSLP